MRSALFNDTWEWDGSDWTQAQDIGPGARSHHAMAYDGARGRIKHQLIVLCRGRRRAPNLTRSDRLLSGFGSLFPSPARIRKVAIAVPRGTGPSRLSFIGRTRDSLWSVDLLQCDLRWASHCGDLVQLPVAA
jgi:hypothetical protein